MRLVSWPGPQSFKVATEGSSSMNPADRVTQRNSSARFPVCIVRFQEPSTLRNDVERTT